MTLRINSRGTQVAKLQAELKAAGFSPGSVDGVFGRNTLAAVKKYQAKYGLSVDGVVGPRTWNKLLTDGKAPGKSAGTSKAAAAASAPRGQSVMGYVRGSPKRIRISSIGNGKMLRTDAAQAFNRMKAAARRAGVTLSPVSGFRSMAQQKALYAAYRAGRGNLAARPGYSNHQGGISVDVQTNNSYSSKAYKWLAKYGRQYGFVNDVRGEPWHWTYKR